MKILQINSMYAYLSTGRTTYEMDEYFKENGIESIACSSVPHETYKNFYIIGSKLDHKIHAFLSRVTGKQGYFSYFATKKFLRFISKEKPDIVHLRILHANYINVNMLLKYLGDNNIATVITLHDCWFFTGKCCYYTQDNCNKWQSECGKCPALHRYNDSFVFDWTKQMQKDKKYYLGRIQKLGIVGVSNWIVSEAKQSSILKDSKAVYKYIYNWIDLEKFYIKDPVKLKEKYNLSNKFVILGMSQVWIERKGLDIFKALSNLIPDDAVIILIGKTNNNVSSDKIKFLGTIHDVDVLADYYSLADVFVNPSIQETFGKTTAESMACGTPVIGCNTTATPELIGNDEKCGYLIDNRCAEVFYNKIKLIKEKGKDYYSKNCREKALNIFDKNKNIKEYISFYKELLDCD